MSGEFREVIPASAEQSNRQPRSDQQSRQAMAKAWDDQAVDKQASIQSVGTHPKSPHAFVQVVTRVNPCQDQRGRFKFLTDGVPEQTMAGEVVKAVWPIDVHRI